MSHESHNVEDLPETVRLKWKHFHGGNSTQADREGISGVRKTPYVTVAWIESRDTRKVLARSIVTCSKKDSPRRKIGREAAIVRVLREFFEKDAVELDYDSIPRIPHCS